MKTRSGMEKQLGKRESMRHPSLMRTLIKSLLVGMILLVSTSTSVFGYDFSDVRRSLVKDLEEWQGYASRNKIAIVFNNENREQIKQNYNLVALKKDLARELLKSFDVADPIIVEEIIRTNQLEYQQIASSKSVLGQFADRANSVHVLLVDLQPKPSTLLAEIKLYNRDYSRISTVITEIGPESESAPSYNQSRAATQPVAQESSVFDSFSFGSGSNRFVAGQNDSWVYFTPTALLNPEVNALHFALWFKDIADVDVQVVRFRYDIKFLELLQLGVQSYAIAEKTHSQADEPNLEKESGHHSTYLSLKFQMVNDSVIPVNLAVGVRRRLLWDPDNTDFRSRDQVDKQENPDEYDEAEERDEENDRYNRLTLQAMVTGKLENIGILYNVYLDSQTIGTGIKYVLLPEIKLFADNIYYYYEEPDILTDTAAGIQFYNPYGSADIMYQFETQQIQLGFNLDF